MRSSFSSSPAHFVLRLVLSLGVVLVLCGLALSSGPVREAHALPLVLSATLDDGQAPNDGTCLTDGQPLPSGIPCSQTFDTSGHSTFPTEFTISMPRSAFSIASSHPSLGGPGAITAGLQRYLVTLGLLGGGCTNSLQIDVTLTDATLPDYTGSSLASNGMPNEGPNNSGATIADRGSSAAWPTSLESNTTVTALNSGGADLWARYTGLSGSIAGTPGFSVNVLVFDTGTEWKQVVIADSIGPTGAITSVCPPQDTHGVFDRTNGAVVFRQCDASGGHVIGLSAPAEGTASDPVTCGPAPTGGVSGSVWDDTDQDGLKDGSEPPLSGINVCAHLLVPPDTQGAQYACNSSSGTGAYTIPALPDGYYRLAQVLLGRSQSYPGNGAPHFIQVTGGAVVTGMNFGSYAAAPGEIQGVVYNDLNTDGDRDGGEPGVSGVPVCALALVTCVNSGAGGNYSIPNVAAGNQVVWITSGLGVFAIPLNKTVTVGPGQTVTGIDLGRAGPTPPPPEVTVSSPYTSGGIPVIVGSAPISKDVTAHCGAASPTQVKLVVDYPVAADTELMMSNTGGENWSVVFTPAGTGASKLIFYVDCPPDTAGFPENIGLIAGEDEIQQGGNIYIDPSGVIYDACNANTPISGATVTLLKESPPTSGNFVVPNSSDHIPSINPQATSTFGYYGWVVVAGNYKVQASKAGYVTAFSQVVTIPPFATDVNIYLQCVGGDQDNDTVLNSADNCISVANLSQTNGDGDPQGDACDNCPMVANANQANRDGDSFGDACEAAHCVATTNWWMIPAGDDDCDGFTTAIETDVDIVTDPVDSCANSATPNNETDDKWPADFNDNRLINTLDLTGYATRLGTIPSTALDRRHDLNQNGVINTLDLSFYATGLGRTCVPPV